MPGSHSRSAGALLDGGPGIAHLERRPQHLDRRGIDLGPRGRPRDAGEQYTAARLRLLQPVHRLGCRHCENPRLVSHGAIPVHPGARIAQGQRPAIDAERPAIVPRSEIGPGRRAARHRAGAAAAAARRRSQGDLLRPQDCSGAARRRRAPGVLHGICARYDLELGGSRQVSGAACRRRRLAGRIRGRYVRPERCEPRRYRAGDSARLLGIRAVSRPDLCAAQRACRLLAARRRR